MSISNYFPNLIKFICCGFGLKYIACMGKKSIVYAFSNIKNLLVS